MERKTSTSYREYGETRQKLNCDDNCEKCRIEHCCSKSKLKKDKKQNPAGY